MPLSHFVLTPLFVLLTLFRVRWYSFAPARSTAPNSLAAVFSLLGAAHWIWFWCGVHSVKLWLVEWISLSWLHRLMVNFELPLILTYESLSLLLFKYTLSFLKFPPSTLGRPIPTVITKKWWTSPLQQRRFHCCCLRWKVSWVTKSSHSFWIRQSEVVRRHHKQWQFGQSDPAKFYVDHSANRFCYCSIAFFDIFLWSL